MAFEDILVSLTTYPERTKPSGIDDAVALAAALESRISAIACEVKVPAPASPLGSALLNVPALVSAELKKSVAAAAQELAEFQKAAEQRGVFQEVILEKCTTPEFPDLVTDYARLRDLTVVPMPDVDTVERWLAETLIFGSGRPTVVLPERPRWSKAVALNTVVVAWDFSRNSTRAVADALPLLKKAKLVCILTVNNEKVFTSGRSGAELAKYLARHGINVVLDEVDAAGRDIATVFESHLTLRDADLLVMGAYGHSRFREFVLGGATRSMLVRPPVPVFLSH
ncbi:MAG: universal stress protein [Afipia sp.]|jgi:nucleotide-binding universal stress UspA family protein|nr:universal stress protein [Afipia sp.]MBS4003096.1 universal stress protein [Afipia sp.]WIG51410.1 MAG: UspA [Afipia sp.]